MRYQAQEYGRALFEALQDSDEANLQGVLDNFVQLLQEKGDLYLYPAIEKEYEALARQGRGITRVEMTTARKLDITSELTELIRSVVGSDVEIIEKTDDRLIGGAVLRVGDTLVDASIRSRLSELRSRLAH